MHGRPYDRPDFWEVTGGLITFVIAAAVGAGR